MVIVVMGVSDLAGLIEMLNFNYALALLLEYAAFIKLRISKPEGKNAKRAEVGNIMLPTLAWLTIFLSLLSFSSEPSLQNTIEYNWLCYSAFTNLYNLDRGDCSCELHNNLGQSCHYCGWNSGLHSSTNQEQARSC